MGKTYEELYAIARNKHTARLKDDQIERESLIKLLFFQSEKDAIIYARELADAKTPQKTLRGEFKPDSEKIAKLADTLIEKAKDIMRRISDLEEYDDALPTRYGIHQDLCTGLFAYGYVRRELLKDPKAGQKIARNMIGVLKNQDAQLKVMELVIESEDNLAISDIFGGNGTPDPNTSTDITDLNDNPFSRGL